MYLGKRRVWFSKFVGLGDQAKKMLDRLFCDVEKWKMIKMLEENNKVLFNKDLMRKRVELFTFL